MSNPWVQPDPTRLMWVGLDLCDGLGWVELFLTHHGGLGKKTFLTRPMHTPKYNNIYAGSYKYLKEKKYKWKAEEKKKKNSVATVVIVSLEQTKMEG